MATAVSSVQKKRVNKGLRLQRLVSGIIKKLGFELADKPPRVKIAECPTTSMNVDEYLPYEKLLIEVKGSVKDGVLMKVVLQAKNIKRQFPECKFVVIVVQQPRRDETYIRHLKACPFIDEVIVIWQDEWRLQTEMRKLVTPLLSTFLNNNFHKRVRTESEKIIESVNSNYETFDDEYHMVYIDKKMGKYFRENDIDEVEFIKTGSLG
tara:strand:+ start:54 stop:677 length:624 start_codon:yes stop_codon:yes gene_type:complete